MQTTIQYNFKSIPVVPKSNELIDIILSKTQRKTPTVTHPGYKITRIRRFYMRKVKFTYNTIEEKIDSIVKNFPKLEDIHPFYADLINILYDKDHFKMALGYINTAKNICEKISNDYVKLLKYGDSLYRCKQLKVAALGRMATTLKKLNSSLSYLEEVRKHLGRLPSIDPNTRTLILTGFPNVGKSSFMNKITYAGSEVQPYPFTTQSLFAGHTYYKNIKWQVIDTPGILDRPLEERNTIEMQAITALAHLEACILYFIDVSESCGYSIANQIQLFTSIKPLFKNKPLVIIANKTDLKPYKDMNPDDRELLENVAKEHNTYLIQMSNETGDGVSDVKSAACEILLKFRVNSTKGKDKDITGMDKIYVATPKAIRGNRNRKVNIPQSVIDERNIQENSNSQEIDMMDDEEKKKLEEKILREGEISTLEKKITHNPVKEMIEQNGGEGVYFFPVREHFKLEQPEWKYDVWPEIMDGKNVFDYVDPDILQKLEVLEKAEEEIQENEDNENDNQMEDDDGEQESDDDIDELLIDAHEKVMENQNIIREKHKLVTGSQLPRRLRGLTETEKFMSELRTDKKEQLENLKMLSQKKRREDKERLRKRLLKEAKKEEEGEEDEEECNDDDMMEVDEDDDQAIKQFKKRRLNVSAEEAQKIARKEKIERQKQLTIERMKRKLQKNWNKDSRVDEADRKIASKMPKHLNTGKRGIGKTNWR